MPEMDYARESDTIDRSWEKLFIIGAVAAFISALFFPLQIIVYIISPPPGTVLGFFTLFHDNMLLGLLSMDLLIVIEQILAIPMYLSLFAALRRYGEANMVLATTLSFIGIAAYFASNTAFNMLSLSSQYWAATTDAQRTVLQSAGEAMLAIYNGTAFLIYYNIGGLAIILISIVMLKSKVFGKAAAYAGILSGVIGYGLYVPKIGIFISIFSIVFLFVWYILIARGLLRLARAG